MGIHISVNAVHKVIGCHNGPRIGLSHSNLKRFQIDLPQRPLLNQRVYCQTMRLLLVSNEVWEDLSVEDVSNTFRTLRTLYGGRNALVLQATDVLSRELPREKRVLGEGFKIPSSQGMSMHADRWGEQNMGCSRLDLVGKMLADLV